ncbi:MAG: hypothetical protein HLUCCO02_04020 [Idiomarinaceae bacterium HL-53]|nr:MAG: hypothetical protein HLUCCO02_04020 [Idiomarinaceae bacterium HL-53]CUS49183.1 hypothetical protein Ga0003345_2170 [Idiomarinaceae bacterium HL-53]
MAFYLFLLIIVLFVPESWLPYAFVIGAAWAILRGYREVVGRDKDK